MAVRTYAVRVEDGIGVSAEEAATEIARVLADPRGWQELESVSFHQVATSEEAEFTMSLGSPPTVDELCLPAKTGGTWSCRIGPDVALNSDRWLHATPTYDDLAEYRAYMINHEVGHFLGHGHARNERRTRLVVLLSAVMMVAEISVGTVTGSMALVADGWHMSTHAAALAISSPSATVIVSSRLWSSV